MGLPGYNLRTNGGLAQLGERLHGMQEVIGSSPLSSTNPEKYLGFQNLGIVPGFLLSETKASLSLLLFHFQF
jgi:hypothetical protein